MLLSKEGRGCCDLVPGGRGEGGRCCCSEEGEGVGAVVQRGGGRCCDLVPEGGGREGVGAVVQKGWRGGRGVGAVVQRGGEGGVVT